MKKIFSVIFFICFFIQLINAQIRIDGKVVDEEGLAVQAHAETYCGLVEVGVGFIPGCA